MCDISNGITAELFLYLIQQGKKGCLKSNIRKHIAVNIIFKFGRLQVQIEQDLSSNYISGIHLIKKSVEQFIRSVVA